MCPLRRCTREHCTNIPLPGVVLSSMSLFSSTQPFNVCALLPHRCICSSYGSTVGTGGSTQGHTCLAAAISCRAQSRLAFELLPGSPPWTPDTMQKPRCPPSAWHRSACFTIRSTSLQNEAHMVGSQDKVMVGLGHSTVMLTGGLARGYESVNGQADRLQLDSL